MSNSKRISVSNTADLELALAAGYESSQIDFDPSEAVAKARAEGLAAGRAENAPDITAMQAEAVKAERVRIAKIQTMARPGFDAELKAAIEEGKSPEAFAFALLEAANDRGITLEAIQKASPKAAPHSSAPEAEQKPKAPIDMQAIYKARAQTKE